MSFNSESKPETMVMPTDEWRAKVMSSIQDVRIDHAKVKLLSDTHTVIRQFSLVACLFLIFSISLNFAWPVTTDNDQTTKTEAGLNLIDGNEYLSYIYFSAFLLNNKGG